MKQTLTQTSVQSKQLSWSERGLDVKQRARDWELICSFASCVSESESVVPGQLSAIHNNFFLLSLSRLSLPLFCSVVLLSSLSTCSSTKMRWREMPATTTVCCATTRPRPNSTSSNMCAPWSTNAARASGSFSACRRACRRRTRTLAPFSPSANALLQTQVRTWPFGSLRVNYFVFFILLCSFIHELSSSGSVKKLHMSYLMCAPKSFDFHVTFLFIRIFLRLDSLFTLIELNEKNKQHMHNFFHSIFSCKYDLQQNIPAKAQLPVNGSCPF